MENTRLIYSLENDHLYNDDSVTFESGPNNYFIVAENIKRTKAYEFGRRFNKKLRKCNTEEEVKELFSKFISK